MVAYPKTSSFSPCSKPYFKNDCRLGSCQEFTFIKRHTSRKTGILSTPHTWATLFPIRWVAPVLSLYCPSSFTSVPMCVSKSREVIGWVLSAIQRMHPAQMDPVITKHSPDHISLM